MFDCAVTPLYNHSDEASAYVMDGYPYGRLTCQIKFWLEFNESRGLRFCSRTQNPKNEVWNAVKKSTYCLLAGAMFLDDKGHCHWQGLSEYDSAYKVKDFLITFPKANFSILRNWCLMKIIYCSKKLKAEGGSDFDKEEMKKELETWRECSRIIEGVKE